MDFKTDQREPARIIKVDFDQIAESNRISHDMWMKELATRQQLTAESKHIREANRALVPVHREHTRAERFWAAIYRVFFS